MNDDVIIALAALGNAVMRLESVLEDLADPNDRRLLEARAKIEEAGAAAFRLTVAASRNPS